jgi:hypothetical protein
MKKIKWIILILLNIFLELFCLWLLLYFNTFINESFIPDRFIWVNGTRPDKPLLAGVLENNLILCGEAITILFICYLLNRWVFVDLLALDKPNIIAKRIFILLGLFTFIIILVTTVLELK